VNHAVPLPALDGRDPLGFLASLGLLRLLTEQSGDDIALSFSTTTAQAVLHGPFESTIDIAEKLTAVTDTMAGGSFIPNVPAGYPIAKVGVTGGDPMRGQQTDHRNTIATIRALAGDAAVRWHASLVTDLARDNKGQVALTQFSAPAGQQTVKSFFEKTTTLVRANPDFLHQALTSWQRVPNYTGEYLDHRVLRSAADLPAGESSEVGVPGATWLAIMALPLFRLTGDGTTLTTTLWRRAQRHPPTMIWPLWRQPLNLAATIVLIEHPAIDIAPRQNDNRDLYIQADRHTLDALGIFAIVGAKRRIIDGRKSAGVLVPVPIVAETTPAHQ
jgi:hypothetical protein